MFKHAAEACNRRDVEGGDTRSRSLPVHAFCAMASRGASKHLFRARKRWELTRVPASNFLCASMSCTEVHTGQA